MAEVIKPTVAVDNTETVAVPIAKPSAFDLDKFRTKRAAVIANVETLQTALPHHGIAAAKDFVRLHPDEQEYWSPELCLVNVPIKGQKHHTLHLIEEDLALQYLASGRLTFFRLALATKPHNVFFLCQVPSRNLDNLWNDSALKAAEQAKTAWVQVTSRKDEGVENYKVDFSRDPDAFPEPNWPKQSIGELIGITFTGRMIDRAEHPALLRLLGAKQSLT